MIFNEVELLCEDGSPDKVATTEEGPPLEDDELDVELPEEDEVEEELEEPPEDEEVEDVLPDEDEPVDGAEEEEPTIVLLLLLCEQETKLKDKT